MNVQFNYCDPQDEHAYRDSLAALWAKGEQFINLEGDVAPWPGALTELWECPQPWCVFAYLIHQAMNANGIGCVKFSADFIKQMSQVWTKYPRSEVYNWRSLDAMLLHEAEPMKPHVHTPPVLHLNMNHL